MMRSCASAAKLRAAGPFSQSASNARFEYGFPPPRIVNSAVVLKSQRERRNGAKCYARSGKPFQDAGRKTTPSSSSPVVTKRQSAMISLRASATIMALRVPLRLSGCGAIPQCERALLLKHQKAPGELDHGAADPGVAGSGEPLFATARAALIRRAC